MAYWLFTAEKMFDSPTLAALLVAHSSQEPVPPSRRVDVKIPAPFDALVLDCLIKDPDSSVQSAEHIVERLEQIEFAAPWSSHRAESWWQDGR